MKLKLIQAGGFAGKVKTAEEDLENHETVLQQHVTDLFQQNVPPVLKSLARDQEHLLLEFNGKVLPVHQLSLNPQMEKLVEHMCTKLRFEK